MVSRPDPTSGCRGKARYRKFARAETAASRSAKQNGEAMHAYKCVHCNHFHVGAHMKEPRRPEAAPIIEVDE